MTIKKRIKLSNLFMILIPACVALVIGGASLGVGYAVLTKSGGTGFDQENFYSSREAAAKEIKECFSHQDPKSELSTYCAALDQNQVRLLIQTSSGVYYAFGTEQSSDSSLLSKAADGSFISLAGRQLYYTVYSYSNVDYDIAIFCNDAPLSYQNLKITIAVAAAVLLFSVLVSIGLSDWLLTRNLFKKISAPLDLLLEGAQKAAKGEYGYQISYSESDEFSPVIAEYNSMSRQVSLSIDQIKGEEQAREILISGLVHDIKSPLTSIILAAQGIRDGVAGTKTLKEKYLSIICSKADEINGLVGQMNCVSSVTKNSGSLKSIRAYLESYLQENQEQLQKGGLTAEIEAQQDFSLPLGEPELSRILSNLTQNSLKYKDKPQGKIIFRLEPGEKENCLAVYDDGPGVSPTELPLLFDAFYRGDQARSHPENGSGLGLAIVKKIVSQAGGRVEAQKGPLGGLEIDICFPKEAS